MFENQVGPAKVIAAVGAQPQGSSVYHHLNTMDVIVNVWGPDNVLIPCGVQAVGYGEIRVVPPLDVPLGTLLRVVIIG